MNAAAATVSRIQVATEIAAQIFFVTQAWGSVEGDAGLCSLIFPTVTKGPIAHWGVGISLLQ